MLTSEHYSLINIYNLTAANNANEQKILANFKTVVEL